MTHVSFDRALAATVTPGTDALVGVYRIADFTLAHGVMVRPGDTCALDLRCDYCGEKLVSGRCVEPFCTLNTI
jgi:hypothetical protein